jgi:hypothetical protein
MILTIVAEPWGALITAVGSAGVEVATIRSDQSDLCRMVLTVWRSFHSRVS